MRKGIDVSHWNGNINWGKVAAKDVDFAFAKSTEGQAVRDNTFQENFKGMKDNDIKAGAYHVFRMTSSPEDQADNINHVLSQANFDKQNDKLAISATTGICAKPGDTKCDDPSQHTNQERANNLYELLTKLEGDGYHPMIYASPKTWNDYFYTQHGHDFSEYPLWVAHWGVPTPTIPHDWANAGKNYTVWNYTDNGVVDGIEGKVCEDIWAPATTA
ncbi:glycoside hydrolase [Wolbachia pipientis]|uniref:Glycoside hydrolase n=1 Tax=Wolbachia pipientis TaxID=955 RepID=A0A1E7QJF5_WOLPI|nr:glycoside hydrolase family 25 protein [Wolbachia pipientis]OEY86476.1 glycoside hydrolase [Wolbachia pipientis]